MAELSATIFALATPAQPSNAALVRVSGSLAPRLARAMTGAEWGRKALRTTLRLPVGEVPCVAWLLPAPRTLTGDDTLELIVPGHPDILRELEQRLREQGCRDAEPGEFTRRAVEAGKLDLSRAEATLALVTATDEAARRQALADLSGESALRVAEIAERLRALSARYEMSFDFSEEEHAESEEERLVADLRALVDELRAILGRESLKPRRELPEVALFGPPNAGKSSLFNALIGRHRALVSEHPGTTRDAVRQRARIGKQEAVLIDLSGVGVQDADRGRFAAAARKQALTSDVLLVLAAPGNEVETAREFEALTRQDPAVRSRAMWVNTMSDLRGSVSANALRLEQFTVSAASGTGLETLREALQTRLTELAGGGVTSLLRRKAGEALALLDPALADAAAPPEAVAGEVRRALTLLDEALLSDAPGDVLDLIFSRFCIGK